MGQVLQELVRRGQDEPVLVNPDWRIGRSDGGFRGSAIRAREDSATR